MKALIGISAMGMLGGGLYAADAFTPGTIYEKPFDQAYDDLSTMKILPFIGQIAPYGVKHPDGAPIRMMRTSDSISWTIAVGQSDIGTFIARLAPVAGGSRTRVLLLAQPAKTETNAAKANAADELIVELTRLVMTEQVDARLEDRAVDSRAIALAMVSYIATDEGNLRATGDGVQEAMKGVASHLKETMRPPERWVPPPTTGDASRPSTSRPSNGATSPSDQLPSG